MLYNMRYGTGRGFRFHLPFPYSGFIKRTGKNVRHITAFIEAENPDIVGLVEVRGRQVQAIANELKYVPLYNSKYLDSSFAQKVPILKSQGNAFLTRPTVKNTTLHYFTKGVKRLAIELELEDVTIFLVHLSLKFRSRQWQLTQLHDLIKQTHKPVMVAGDLNMFWGSKEIELFLSATGLKSANIGNQLTYPSRKPKRQLDFILHSPDIKLSAFKVCDGVLFSDHLPIVCEFSVSA